MRLMKKKVVSQVLAMFLAIMFVVTSPLETLNIQAVTGTSYDVLLNGENTLLADKSFSNALKISYGDDMALYLSNLAEGEDISFSYVAGDTDMTSDEIPWIAWTNDTYPTQLGNYYIGYSYTDGDGKSYENADGSYGFTLVKGTLSTPANLSWNNGSVATWDGVTTKTSGQTVANGVLDGYKVTLYRDGTKVDDYTVASDKTSYDFTDLFLTKEGEYTFTVQALVKSSQQSNYNSSAVSSISSAKARAVKVLMNTNAGLSDCSNVYYAIVGHSTLSQVTLGYTVKDNWSVQSKAFEENITGASIQDDVVSFDASYSDTLIVHVDMTVRDTLVPTITKFEAGTKANDEYGKLIAQAKDDGVGLTAYAFSKTLITSEAQMDQISWTELPEPVIGTTKKFTHAVSEAGTYYFYVRDNADSYSVSSVTFDPVKASEVDYHDYYDNGVKKDKTGFLVGSEAYELAIPSRPGYTFEGWYTTETLDGDPITSISTHQDSAYQVYAKWSREAISITTTPQPYSGDYDGDEHELSVVVGNLVGTIGYQWYKDGQPITGATSATYRVKDAKDSGSYYVQVSVTVDGKALTTSTEAVAVTINKVDLNITAANKTITYKDAAPEYTYTFDGFVNGEGFSTDGVTKGSISCDYIKDDLTYGNAKDYDIKLVGFAADNYNVICTDATLTVSPKNVNATDSDVSVTLSKTDYTYTGAANEPEAAIKDNLVDIAATNYVLTYENSVEAGTALAKVVFSNNYVGTITKEYTINKATFSANALMTGWTYGDTECVPSVDTNTSGGEISFTYVQYVNEQTITLDAKPSDAGSYGVKAVIAETANYKKVTTEVVDFVIKKRAITLEASSATWAYDGNDHTSTDYTMTGDFAGTDSFQSVVVKGKINSVTEVENEVVYQLSSSTKASNYNITCIKGKLTVTARALTIPANHKWSTTSPGVATWVALARSGLTVQYELTLYRVNNGNAVKVGDTQTTFDNTFDFSDTIRNASSENDGYYYTIQAFPYAGDNKGNYVMSDLSQNSVNMYTAKVSMIANTGVSSVYVKEDGITERILLQGETTPVNAVASSGYSLADTVWTSNSLLVSFADSTLGTTNMTISSQLTSGLDINVYGNSSDDIPEISDFSATLSNDCESANLSFTATDSLGLSGWMITTSSTQPLATATGWNELSNPLTLTQSQTVYSAGSYYLWVKDTSGNVVGSQTPVVLYSIQFNAGDGGTGEMASILKIQNVNLKLPEVTFVKDGFSFQNWKGTSGIYEDEGSFAANANDTLTACWTDVQLSYTVEYYQMAVDGTYPEQATQTSVFTAGYGVQVSSDSSAIRLSLSGMEVDSTKIETIKVNASGKVLKVYYKRNSYTITYSYQRPADAEATSVVQTYLYGQSVDELTKPSVAGYTFVGWRYGESGTTPATMPNKNITATGTFSGNLTSYQVVYYEENLAGNGFTKVDSLTETRQASHNSQLTFNQTDAKAIEGFTCIGVVTSSGIVAGNVDASVPTASAIGTVSALSDKTLYCNIYYSRNKYALTLNVWKASRESEENKLYTYTWSDISYGQALTASDYEDYQKDSWTTGKDVEGYELATEASWSTGDAPTVMPAGNVTVTRDYIKTINSSYKIQVYFESATEGSYSLATTLNYYANVGEVISVGSNSTDYTLNYNNFSSALPSIIYYNFDSDNANNITSGTVTDVDGGQTQLVLKIYMERKLITSAITYYYNDGTNSTNNKIGTRIVSGKWGTQYDCKPLAFFSGEGVSSDWNSEYTSDNLTIGGVSAEDYDFKANNYIASFSGYFSMTGVNCYVGMKYDSVEKLSNSTMATFNLYSNQTINQSTDLRVNQTVNVYYNLTDASQKHYYVDVAYSPNNLLKETDKTTRKVTATIDGTTYYVRVANKADVFESDYTEGAVCSEYPGLQYLLGTYASTSTLKDGFTEVTYNDSTYYAKTIDGVDYLYVIDNANQFFAGNRISYNFNNTTNNKAYVGYSSIEEYLANYVATHSDDERAEGAYIVNNPLYAICYGNATYTDYFYYKPMCRVTYDVNGTQCLEHLYAQGKTVTPSCTHSIFQEKDGFEIQWYKDSSYTQKAGSFVINSDTTLYGKYEKKTLTYHRYVYYQLTDNIELNGEKVDYITAARLSSLSGNSDFVEQDTAAEDSAISINFTDGSGEQSTVNIPYKEYYYKGKLVMKDFEYPTLSYSRLTFDYSTYVQDGFHFDDKNENNNLSAYCESSAISLEAYIARDEYTLTVNPNNSKTTNTTETNYKYEQTVTVPTPTKNGYDFDQWTWEGSTPLGSTGEQGLSFTMPNANISLTAAWNKGTFNKTIIHYFQTLTSTYNTDLVSDLMSSDGETATVYFNGQNYTNGKVYYENAKIKGISLEVTLSEKTMTLYFSKGTLNDGIISVESNYLLAAVTSIQATTDDSITVGTYELPAHDVFSMFTYQFTIYQYETDVTTLAATDTFSYQYDMNVSYYYTRRSDYKIRTTDKAVNSETTGTVLLGAGTHFYGETVELKANVSAGYVFMGWYKAEDVLDSYDKSSSKALSEYSLLADLSQAAPVSTDLSYSIDVMDDEDYVSLTQASDAATATVTASSAKNTYIYGYEMSGDNAISAKVSFPENYDTANYVSGYQWYENGNLISGATTATYLFPVGKTVGTYQYHCAITVTRRDNQRTSTATTDDFGVTVTPAQMTTKDINYEGNYDGNKHSATVLVEKPSSSATYKIYYATYELNSSNYTMATQSAITYENVKSDKGSYNVYYYVDNTDGNYLDATGSLTVTINPIKLTISSANVFTKTYDGEKTISGDVNEAGTDRYRLAHGNYYTVSGLLSKDQGGTYVLDFDALFDSEHVDNASIVELSNMRVVDTLGVQNNNYYFTTGTSLEVTAYINPLAVNSSWSSNTTYTYDGNEHLPQFTISEGQSLPNDIKFVVTGKQTNVGDYTAYANVVTNEEDTEYKTSDYIFSQMSKDYSIIKRGITITPVTKTNTYNGKNQYLTDFTATGTGLVSGHSFTASTDQGGKAADDYTIKAAEVHLYSGTGNAKTEVTDNYEVTCGTANLTITKKSVTISNILAKDKVYDGSNEADLDWSNIVFSGVVDGEQLDVVDKTIKGTFSDASVGTDKTVTIPTDEIVLSGDTKDNYSLDVSGSQNSDKADITKGTIKVTINPQTTTYGENVDFSVGYSNFAEGEDATSAGVTGNVTYQIRKMGTQEAYSSYLPTVNAGTYQIKADISGLSADNYGFELVNNEEAQLEVLQRLIHVQSAEGVSLSKVYDGTTTAKDLMTSTDYQFTAITGQALTGVVNGDNVLLKTYSTSFDYAHVSEATKVVVDEMTLNNDNYQLDNSTFAIAGTILQKALTVKADEKSITYGDAAPQYSAKITGFIEGENETNLSNSLTFACDYATDNALTRGVRDGGYTITPSGYTSTDYDIDYQINVLTVKKAVITVKAVNKTMVYGDTIPEFTFTTSGLKYDEVFDTVALLEGEGDKVTYQCDATSTSIAGRYNITPVTATQLSADNYTFATAKGYLDIDLHYVKINGITVNDKVYDGTKAVAQNQIVLTGVSFTGILDGDTEQQGITVTGVYTDKNVGTDIQVDLDVKLNSYLTDRYYILADEGNQTTAQSSITKKDLDITALDVQTTYGQDAPAFAVTYSGLVTGDNAANSLTNEVSYVCSYVKNDDVNTYDITPQGYSSLNYNCLYHKGTLTVNQTSFAKAKPIFSATAPGTIEWEAVLSIGKVDVSQYIVSLYKSGEETAVDTQTLTPDILSYDFSTKMKEASGLYYVKVQAVPDTTYNEDNKNVLGSVSEASAKLASVKVTPVYATDTTTIAGKGNSISINDGESYQMIAGEKAIPLNASMVNMTGYQVKSWTGSNSAATVSNITISGTSIEAECQLNNLTSIADINVTLTLNSREAVVLADNALTDPSTAEYGYSTDKAPRFVVTPKVDTNDTVTTAGYDYTYQWQYRKGATGIWTDIVGATGVNGTFPTEMNAATNYQVRCCVTGTRKDNGNTATYNTSTGGKYLVVIITKSKLSASVSLSDWTYGEARKTPVVQGNTENGEEKFYYSSVNLDTADWSETMPTDAGTYYVKAHIAETANYGEFTTHASSFTIEKAQLTKPDGLLLGESPTAPYGLISWNAVTGPKENAGITTGTSIDVTYRVSLYKEAETDVWNHVFTGTTDECSYDLAEKIVDTGKYKFVITALSSNTDNCLDSDNSEILLQFGISASIETCDVADESIKNIYTKEYDGQGIKLTVVDDAPDGATYVWLRNNQPIENTNSKTYIVKDVSQTGTYTCTVSVNGETIYATNHLITITPKSILSGIGISQPEDVIYNGMDIFTPELTLTHLIAGIDTVLTKSTDYTLEYEDNHYVGTATITITGINNYKDNTTKTFAIGQRPITLLSASCVKDYDGTALTSSAIVVSSGSIGARDHYTVSFTGTQTNVGEIDNTYTDVKFMDEQDKDVTSNYDITALTGKLTVESIKDTILVTGDFNKTYDGKEVNQPVEHTDFTRNGIGIISFTYAIKNGENDYTPISYVPKDAGDYAVKVCETEAGNYQATESAYCDFTIAKRNIVYRAANKESRYFETMEPLTFTTEGTVVTGDALNPQITTTATSSSAIGKYDINITYTPNDNYDVKVYGAKYSILNETIQYDADNYVGTYDGTAHSITVTPTSPSDATVYYSEHELNGDNYTEASTQPISYKTAGTKTVYFYIEKENYKGVAGSKTVTINTKALNFVWSGEQQYFYDNTEKSVQATVDGEVDGDDVSVGEYLNNGKTLVGDYTAEVASLQGEDASNYSLEQSTNKTYDYRIIKDIFAPTGRISIDLNWWDVYEADADFDTYYPSTQSVSISAEDIVSGAALNTGVKTVSYYLSTEKKSLTQLQTLDDASWTAYTGNFDIAPQQKVIIYAKITDNAYDTNVTYISSTGFILDTLKPVVTGIEDGGHYCGDTPVTVSDNLSGVQTVMVNGIIVTPDADGKFILSDTTGTNETEKTVVVTDAAGNVTTVTVDVYHEHAYIYTVDPQHPDTIIETCSHDCGKPQSTAKITAHNAPYTGNEIETGEVTYSETWCGGSLDISYVNNIEIGTATASIKIQSTTAEADFEITPAGTVATPEADLSVTPVYITEQDVALSCQTAGAVIYYTTDGTVPTTQSAIYSGSIHLPGQEGKSVVTTIRAMAVKYGYNQSEIATFIYTVHIPDTHAPEGTITLDTTVWSEFLAGITMGLFFNVEKTITIAATDNESGVDKIYYAITDKGMTLDQMKTYTDWTEYTEALSFDDDGKRVVYAKIVDKEGNATIINSDGLVFDMTNPNITGIEDGKTYCESVTFGVSDENLKEVKVDGQKISLNEDSQYTIVADNLQHVIYALDKAGNETTYTITVNDDHRWSKWAVTKEATETENGQMERHCNHCGIVQTKDIPSLHNQQTYQGGLMGIIDAQDDRTYKVTLLKGNTTIQSLTGLENGEMVSFMYLPDGAYNLFLTDDILTSMYVATIKDGQIVNLGYLKLGAKSTNTVVEEGAPETVVGDLNELFDTDNYSKNDDATEAIDDGGRVVIQMDTLVPKDKDIVDKLQELAGKDDKTSGLDLDLEVNMHIYPKSGEESVVNIKDTGTKLFVAIPFSEQLKGKEGYQVYRSHTENGEETNEPLSELSTEDRDNPSIEGFYVEDDVVYLWVNKFSTYTIAYSNVHAIGVSLDKDKAELTKANENLTLIATVTPEDAINKNVTWSSSNPSVATVDANGKVIAIANGTTVITVTTEDGGHQASCTVTVNIPAKTDPDTNKDVTGKIPTVDIEKELDVDEDTAKEIQTIASDYNVSIDTLKITDKVLSSRNVDGDIKGSSFSRLKARTKTCKSTKITLRWSKMTGADGYAIYGNYCNLHGRKYTYKFITTVNKNKLTRTIGKLKKNRYFKFIVIAYKKVRGRRITIAASKTIHATTSNKKYGVAKLLRMVSVGKKKINKNKGVVNITLKKKKTAVIKTKEINKNRIIQQHRVICYETSNKKIATVTKKGKIKALRKGKCTIWAYAQNGVYRTIKLTVK